MNLIANLQALAEGSATRHPGKPQEIMKQAIDDLRSSQIITKAYKTGDHIPNIRLENATGTMVDVQELLKNGKLVITFYRGGWCPYCNLELKALQHYLPEIRAKGAQLVAISPETPDNSLTTKEKNDLSFQILSDRNNVVAREMNLVFTLPTDLQKVYKEFGIDLDGNQQNSMRELPIAATYVVEKDGMISYHYLEEDYKLRADPNDIIQTL